MNLIFDIDDTINNLSTYICNKQGIDINKYNEDNMKKSNLSKEEIEIISKEYDNAENYIKCKYYLKEDLFKKLAENNVIVFYSKCIKLEHIQAKHNKLEEHLDMKIKTLDKFDKDNIKNGVYFLPLCVECFEPKPSLILNFNDYIFEDNVSNLEKYDNNILSPNKVLITQSFNKNVDLSKDIYRIENHNDLIMFLEKINKITYKEAKRYKNKKEISKMGIFFSLVFLLTQFEDFHNHLSLKDTIIRFFIAIIIFFMCQFLENKNNEIKN